MYCSRMRELLVSSLAHQWPVVGRKKLNNLCIKWYIYIYIYIYICIYIYIYNYIYILYIYIFIYIYI